MSKVPVKKAMSGTCLPDMREPLKVETVCLKVLVSEMAGYPMPGLKLHILRFFLKTDILDKGATRIEITPDRRVGWAG